MSFGTIFAIVGVSGIVKVGAPILAVVSSDNSFNRFGVLKTGLKNDLVFKLPAFTAIIIGFVKVLSTY